ncbi:unnamed protein product [Haemonchus placei]|uniref:CooT family nickel-binding protein n=1 Tax=Haemonchus placei TaxID=6290 RepID=A0A0N4VZT8_HAEPC|nr:unnamed protein product [Haemonchus placei]
MLQIRSCQTVRVDPDSEQIIICSSIVLHSYGMSFDERKDELKSLVRARPAVVNVKTMKDDEFQEEGTVQNVLIGKQMIVVERKTRLLVRGI